MFEPGFVIGDTYRIERLLAEGGMARLFLASHTRLPDKLFALKVIAAKGTVPTEFALRFRREAEVMAKLKHPHIVEINDWNETPDGAPYLVMEYLEGEDLAQLLRRVGRVPREDTLAMVGQIASALATAHLMGVIHRDLKPGNIFVCNRGPYAAVLKVLDFGIAKLAHDHGALKTSTQALIGTPAYMSPEQARGQSSLITAQSDQFSLGIIIYEMLVGRRPFGAGQDEVWAILSQIITAEMPPLPAELAEIEAPLRRALHKLPEGRFPSIEDFAAALGIAVAKTTDSHFEVRSSSRLRPVPPLIDRPVATTLGTQNGEVKRAARKRTQLYALGATLTVIGTAGMLTSQWAHHPVAQVRNQVAAQAAPEVAAMPAPAPPEAPPEADPVETLPIRRLEPAAPADQKFFLNTPAKSKSLAPDTPVLTGSQDKPTPSSTHAHAISKRANSGAAPAKPKRGEAGMPSTVALVNVTLTGADQAQSMLIKTCPKQIYSVFESGRTYEIKLARAGSLHLVQAPPEVHQSDLRFCLRTMFARNNVSVPAEVMISAKRVK